MSRPGLLPTSSSARERPGRCEVGGVVEGLERVNGKEKERRERGGLAL